MAVLLLASRKKKWGSQKQSKTGPLRWVSFGSPLKEQQPPNTGCDSYLENPSPRLVARRCLNGPAGGDGIAQAERRGLVTNMNFDEAI